MKSLLILGIRGIPAAHGGFETFAEHLAVYLVNKGWSVVVYCQEESNFKGKTTSEWRGIQRIHIPVKSKGAAATIHFDLLSARHAARQDGLVLTLGYNTAIFSILYRLRGKKSLMNMDGIEWKREKWTWIEKSWLYFNERSGCRLANHLIADHPEIKKHLSTRVHSEKITMIPYGSIRVADAKVELLERFDIRPRQFLLVVARPEPENSILEIVQAFSYRKRKLTLVVLGDYSQDNLYQTKVLSAASNEVLFPGAIYEHDIINSLRYYSLLYIHGHTVGGTNPSLVEALGAGQAILAHDNPYNRWVAGDGAEYFSNKIQCENKLSELLSNRNRINEMSACSIARYKEGFSWEKILAQYHKLLRQWVS